VYGLKQAGKAAKAMNKDFDALVKSMRDNSKIADRSLFGGGGKKKNGSIFTPRADVVMADIAKASQDNLNLSAIGHGRKAIGGFRVDQKRFDDEERERLKTKIDQTSNIEHGTNAAAGWKAEQKIHDMREKDSKEQKNVNKGGAA